MWNEAEPVDVMAPLEPGSEEEEEELEMGRPMRMAHLSWFGEARG